MKLGDIAYMEIRDRKDCSEFFNLSEEQRGSVDMLKSYIEKYGHLPSEEKQMKGERDVGKITL